MSNLTLEASARSERDHMQEQLASMAKPAGTSDLGKKGKDPAKESKIPRDCQTKQKKFVVPVLHSSSVAGRCQQLENPVLAMVALALYRHRSV